MDLRQLGRAIFVAFAVVAGPLAPAGEPPFVAQKAAAVDRGVRLLGELAVIAREHESNCPNAQTQRKIKALLEPIRTIEDLSRFALLSSAVAGVQLAEHQNYDAVFDYAQWVCLERIASIPGAEAHAALAYRLKPVLGQDGHPSEQFAELIAKQKQLTHSP